MAIITGDMIVPGGKGPEDHQKEIKFGKSYRDVTDKLGAPRVGSQSANASLSRSRSRSYDYTGMDKAHEISQQAAAGQGAMYDAAMKDPLSIPGLTSRIGAMQRYVNAYKSGQDLPDQVVLPAVRLASESDSFSRSAGRAQSYVRDKMGEGVTEVSPLKDPPPKPGQESAKGAKDGLPSSKGGDGGGAGEEEMRRDPPPPPIGDGGPPPLPGGGDGGDGLGGFRRQLPIRPPADDLPGGDPGMGEGEPVPRPKIREELRGGMKTYSNADMVDDPQLVLRRIQEEMGLV